MSTPRRLLIADRRSATNLPDRVCHSRSCSVRKEQHLPARTCRVAGTQGHRVAEGREVAVRSNPSPQPVAGDSRRPLLSNRFKEPAGSLAQPSKLHLDWRYAMQLPRRKPRAATSLAVLSAMLLVSLAASAPRELSGADLFYYSDDSRIPLSPSTHYVAARFEPGFEIDLGELFRPRSTARASGGSNASASRSTA